MMIRKFNLRKMQEKRLLRVTKNNYPYYGIQIKLPQLPLPPLSQDFDGYTSGKELVYNPSETLQLAKRMAARADILEIVRKEGKKLEEAAEFAKAIEQTDLPDPFTDEVVAELAKSAGERVAAHDRPVVFKDCFGRKCLLSYSRLSCQFVLTIRHEARSQPDVPCHPELSNKKISAMMR